MNGDEIKGMLADYLAGELSRRDRERFEAYLDTDREFAAEVASLRCTLDDMQSLKVPGEEETAAVGTPVRRASWLGPALRYAAVIVLAFGAGFLSRGWSGQHDGMEVAPPVVVDAEASQPQAEWQLRFASAYVRNAGKTGLARSLVSLAEATR